jgi:hypothetical protein
MAATTPPPPPQDAVSERSTPDSDSDSDSDSDLDINKEPEPAQARASVPNTKKRRWLKRIHKPVILKLFPSELHVLQQLRVVLGAHMKNATGPDGRKICRCQGTCKRNCPIRFMLHEYQQTVLQDGQCLSSEVQLTRSLLNKGAVAESVGKEFILKAFQVYDPIQAKYVRLVDAQAQTNELRKELKIVDKDRCAHWRLCRVTVSCSNVRYYILPTFLQPRARRDEAPSARRQANGI